MFDKFIGAYFSYQLKGCYVGEEGSPAVGGSGDVPSSTPSAPASSPTGGDNVTSQWTTNEKPTSDVNDADTPYNEQKIEAAINRAMGLNQQQQGAPALETTPSTPPPEATPAPTPTPTSELEAKLAEYAPVVEQLNALGGLEGLQPYIELGDTFTAAQFDATAFAKRLVALDSDRYINFVWSAVDRHKNDISSYLLNDPALVQQVTASDAGYQEYLKLKEEGIDIQSLAQQQQYGDIDLSTPEGQRAAKAESELKNLRKMVEGVQQQTKSAADQQRESATLQAMQSYDKDVIEGLTAKVQSLGWGDEYKHQVERVVTLAQAKFDKDQEGLQALAQARHFRANGNKAMERRFNNIVQTKLAQHMAEEIKETNKLIDHSRKYQEMLRKQQGSRIDVPGGAASEPTLQPKPVEKPKGDYDERIEAGLLRFFDQMKSTGQLPPNFR